MGFDIVHINLHKTFYLRSLTAAAGRAARPIAVRENLARFLPTPVLARDNDRFRLDHDRPESIGRVRGFAEVRRRLRPLHMRSMRACRGRALREMSEVAVLNANYLLAGLKEAYELPYDRLCMHEFVLSAQRQKREHGICPRPGRREAPDGLRFPSAHRLLPARRARGADDRADQHSRPRRRKRIDAFCGRDARDRPRGSRGSRGRQVGAARLPVERLDEARAVKQLRRSLQLPKESRPTPNRFAHAASSITSVRINDIGDRTCTTAQAGPSGTCVRIGERSSGMSTRWGRRDHAINRLIGRTGRIRVRIRLRNRNRLGRRPKGCRTKGGRCVSSRNQSARWHRARGRGLRGRARGAECLRPPDGRAGNWYGQCRERLHCL